jgi:hypothetical protein
MHSIGVKKGTEEQGCLVPKMGTHPDCKNEEK